MLLSLDIQRDEYFSELLTQRMEFFAKRMTQAALKVLRIRLFERVNIYFAGTAKMKLAPIFSQS